MLCPDIELQAVFRYGVVVLRCEVFPYSQARRLGEVWEGGHGWLVGRAVTVESLGVFSKALQIHIR
jgi:hypothetical protein